MAAMETVGIWVSTWGGRLVMGGLLLGAIAACGRGPTVAPRNIPIHQEWALQPGSEVGGYRVMGGLGDVSIEIKGKAIRAPFDGKVQPTDNGCIAFTSPEVPAYLFRLCGLQRPRLGDVRAGDKIGKGQVLQFAAMRRQPDGTWALVEPAVDILERTVGAGS
ncbi:MAG: hypothetical protein VKJ09_07955 [Leptolyngbya sp.]|nr:hypothetical protein [Leptolyngbya sp.]